MDRFITYVKQNGYSIGIYVNAGKYDGSTECAKSLIGACDGNVIPSGPDVLDTIFLNTSHGIVKINIDDYVVQTSNGAYKIIKSDVFESSYRKIK